MKIVAGFIFKTSLLFFFLGLGATETLGGPSLQSCRKKRGSRHVQWIEELGPAMSCTLSGHKWGAEGHKVQEIPQGSTDDGGGGGLGAGAPYSSKRPPRVQPCLSVRPLPCPLLPAEGSQSLCLTSQGKLSLGGSTLFQRAGGWWRWKGSSGRALICLL